MPRKITGPAAAKAKFDASHERNVVHAAYAGVPEADVINEVEAERKPRAIEVLNAAAQRDEQRRFTDSLA